MSATVGTPKAGLGAVQSPGRAGVKTFFIWVGLNLLAFPIAGELGHVVAGPVDGLMPALFGGALVGAGIGLAQWLMLRRTLDIGPEWIVVTGFGLAIGLAIGAMAVGYETGVPDLIIMGAICGAAVGIGQGVLLRSSFSLWLIWILAMTLLWPIGWVVTEAFGIPVEEQFIVFGASGTVAFGILSGLLLIAGMRRTETESE